MLESLSMLSPSRLRGSICSSSSTGNGVSMLRLASGMPASALLRSLNRLEFESSGRNSEREQQCRLGGARAPGHKEDTTDDIPKMLFLSSAQPGQ